MSGVTIETLLNDLLYHIISYLQIRDIVRLRQVRPVIFIYYTFPDPDDRPGRYPLTLRALPESERYG
jgi:hypothetical protein